MAFCDGLEPQLGQRAVLPMGYIRAYVVRHLTVRAAAEQLAEDYAVALPPSYSEAVRDLRGQLAGLREDRLDEVVEVESAGPYIQAVETEVGGILLAQAGDSAADDEAKLARGADALQLWMSEHPAEINPRYGITVSDAGLAPRHSSTPGRRTP